MNRFTILLITAISVALFAGLMFLSNNYRSSKQKPSSRTSEKCSKCLPRAHLKVYERRSCKPVMSPECNCPLYYDCPPEVTTPPLPEAEVLKLKTLGENACIFDNKVFAIEESLRMPCLPCRCVSGDTLRSVSGHLIKGKAFGQCFAEECFVGRPKPPAGCHDTYFGEWCHRCGTGRICAGHEKADFRCMVDGKTYRYGEKIKEIPNDLCKTCLCDEKFDENDLERSNCWQERCYPTRFQYSSYKDAYDIEENVLIQHCTPIYRETGCCHWDFICEEDFKPEAGILKARLTNLTDTCVLRGESYKLGESIDFMPEVTFLKFYHWKNGTCTCRVPPLMTCYIG